MFDVDLVALKIIFISVLEHKGIHLKSMYKVVGVVIIRIFGVVV